PPSATSSRGRRAQSSRCCSAACSARTSLSPSRYPCVDAAPIRVGAGEGNRTLVVSLEGFCSTIELHPRPACCRSHQRRWASIYRETSRTKRVATLPLRRGFRRLLLGTRPPDWPAEAANNNDDRPGRDGANDQGDFPRARDRGHAVSRDEPSTG